MSRAFVNEDAGGSAPRRDYGLPARDDPGYDAAAADALLEAARAKPKKNRTYDATLDATRRPVDDATQAADADAADLFAEMKKREF